MKPSVFCAMLATQTIHQSFTSNWYVSSLLGVKPMQSPHPQTHPKTNKKLQAVIEVLLTFATIVPLSIAQQRLLTLTNVPHRRMYALLMDLGDGSDFNNGRPSTPPLGNYYSAGNSHRPILIIHHSLQAPINHRRVHLVHLIHFISPGTSTGVLPGWTTHNVAKELSKYDASASSIWHRRGHVRDAGSKRSATRHICSIHSPHYGLFIQVRHQLNGLWNATNLELLFINDNSEVTSNPTKT